jgi:hypothetical protein
VTPEPSGSLIEATPLSSEAVKLIVTEPVVESDGDRVYVPVGAVLSVLLIFETVTGTVVVFPDVSVTIKLYVPLAETV